MVARLTRRAAQAGLLALGLLSLASCGGGGSGGGVRVQAPTPRPGSAAPTYVPGAFAPAGEFKNRCEDPRSGFDIEGNAFPDRAGSTSLENFWLRSWTHETYLWNDEVTDRDPYAYDSRLEYFSLMRTFATTTSGRDKDEFHFSQPTEEFLKQRNSEPTASYGVSLAVFSSVPPRDYRVRYTDPNTPASEVVNGKQQFVRGARILSIDGVSLVSGSSDAELRVLNDGLFPRTAGENHAFQVRDPDGTVRTISIVSADLARKPVNRTRIIDTPSGKVGYVLFNTFSPFASEEEIVGAIETLQAEGVTDLVLDLRYNGGGLLAVASQLAYMVAGNAPTAGNTFEDLRFNDDARGRNPVTGETDNAIPFYRTGLGFSYPSGEPLPELDLNRVYILSTESTCSASEAVINGLRGVDFEVVLIGDITCGKPYGFYPTDNCGETYYTIQFQGVNDKGFGDYADGFVPMNDNFAFGVRLPGCSVPDTLEGELGNEGEPLLAAALQYREDGSCPAATATASAGPGASKQAPILDESQVIVPPAGIYDFNRDMRMPGDIL